MDLPPSRDRHGAAERSLALWRAYHHSGDLTARDELITMHLPLVRSLVHERLRRLPGHYDVDDLVSSGVVAMIGALERYDPAKGASLHRFLWTRVRGGIADELRRSDPVPRRLRLLDRRVTAARTALTVRLGREPTLPEVAEATGTPVDELLALRRELEARRPASLDELELAAIAGGGDPVAAVVRGQARERFRTAFRALSAREQEVAVLIYAGDLTLEEVGARVGLSARRIGQIHRRLRERLAVALHAETAADA